MTEKHALKLGKPGIWLVRKSFAMTEKHALKRAIYEPSATHGSSTEKIATE